MLLPQNTLEKFTYLPSSLSNGSHKKVCIRCDYCQAIFDKTYFHYTSTLKNSTIQKDACSACKSKKQHEAIKVSGGMEAIQAKRSATNIEKYGHAAPANNTAIQEKTKKANLKKYGVEHHIQSKEVKSKIQQTMIERYGIDNLFKDRDYQKEGVRYNRCCCCNGEIEML